MEIELNDLLIAFEKDPTEVREYFESLGIVLSKDWDSFLELFEKMAFKIAGVNNANHLMDAKKLIEDAIKNGQNLREFKKEFRETMKLRAWHADLVVTQNISNAYNGGRFQQQMEGIERFPLLRPIVMQDQKTTKPCKWLAEQNICVRANDKKLKNVYSPRHFHCRTIWVAITEKQKERLGLREVSISEIPEQYLNDKNFRRLPNSYEPDVTGFPKKLKDKLK
jgi:ubiquitin-protein ligase